MPSCTSSAQSGQEIDLTDSAREDVREPDRPIDTRQPVPAFRVRTLDGDVIDSRELVGEEPFMLVYFATWCHVCEMKLPMVRHVLENYDPDLLVLGVVVDDQETWHRVPSYMSRHHLDFEMVRAIDFPRFAMAYSPSGLVPAVTIVGRNGYLVDYQHGYSRRHYPRLVEALRIAHR
jgi:thiol-disulfide isomerase/thioredoxin